MNTALDLELNIPGEEKEERKYEEKERPYQLLLWVGGFGNLKVINEK